MCGVGLCVGLCVGVWCGFVCGCGCVWVGGWGNKKDPTPSRIRKRKLTSASPPFWGEDGILLIKKVQTSPEDEMSPGVNIRR